MRRCSFCPSVMHLPPPSRHRYVDPAIVAPPRALKVWSARELMDAVFPEALDRIEGLLPTVGLAAVIGAEKTGKSLLMLQMGLCISAGLDFLGMPTVPCPALLIEEEGSEPGLQHRLWLQSKALHVSADTPLHLMVCQRIRVDDPYDLAAIEREISTTGARVVLMGPLAQLSNVDDENKADGFNRIARTLGHGHAV